jgi:hypothetical protein
MEQEKNVCFLTKWAEFSVNDNQVIPFSEEFRPDIFRKSGDIKK